MTTQTRERRDWTLLIFIIPIGVVLIIIVGQLAARLLPIWSVNAGMNSNLEPNAQSPHPFGFFEPILPQILIPMDWADTYLLPGSDYSFPPFLVIEPTTTPSPTADSSSNPVIDTPTATATTPSPTPTNVTATATPPSGGGEDGGDAGSTQPPTCQDPAADNFSDPLPCDYTSTTTCTDQAANNNGGPLPCVFPVVSTPDTSQYSLIGIPSNAEEDAPPNNEDPLSDANIAYIWEGKYFVMSISVYVSATPDGNYDLALYEYNNNGAVNLDWIIIGISNFSDGSQYYEVFNWGSGTGPDTNTNVGDIAQTVGSEVDNQPIPVAGNQEVPPSEDELYDPDYVPGSPGTNGTAPQTGILIDVDTAASNPPPNVTYNFVVIISPFGGTGDPETQVDSIQAVEVPIPP